MILQVIGCDTKLPLLSVLATENQYIENCQDICDNLITYFFIIIQITHLGILVAIMQQYVKIILTLSRNILSS